MIVTASSHRGSPKKSSVNAVNGTESSPFKEQEQYVKRDLWKAPIE